MIDITTHTTSVEILKYLATGEIDTIPDIETMVLVADHGLDVGDFFINKTARDLSGTITRSEDHGKFFLLRPQRKSGIITTYLQRRQEMKSYFTNLLT